MTLTKESDFGDDELYSYLLGSCTDCPDHPVAWISQSQDDSLTVRKYNYLVLV